MLCLRGKSGEVGEGRGHSAEKEVGCSISCGLKWRGDNGSIWFNVYCAPCEGREDGYMRREETLGCWLEEETEDIGSGSIPVAVLVVTSVSTVLVKSTTPFRLRRSFDPSVAILGYLFVWVSRK